ncbi:MAG: winged helix-turn-helix transcriptional regulator [Candidatus Aenigmatarchaeota archaeon]
MADVSKEDINEIDDEILRTLTNESEPISTYEVAKKVDVSWSTANTHLKDLQIMDLVKSTEKMSKGNKTRFWWVEQNTIDKFLK